LLAIGLHSLYCSATCYDVTGQIGTDLSPCNITGTSICCAASDFCVNNNFCIQSSNFLLGVYGCTDPNWSSPCRKPCNGTGYYDNMLFACSNAEGVDGRISYCCGSDAISCCDNKQYFSISSIAATEVGIWRPMPTTSSSLTTTTSPSTTQRTSFSTTSATLKPASTQGTTSDKSLAIGLGVGIPLGILLIGTMTFLGWELRRFNNRHALNVQQGAPQGPSQPIPIDKSELDATPPVQVVPELEVSPRQGHIVY